MAIKLSLDKFGSDRLIYSFQNFFVKKNDFYNFIFSYFNLAETSYINTNRKTINFFKHTLYERVGEERLGRILKKLNIDLNEMEKRSLPLRSSTVIEILDGLRDVNVIDLDEFIKKIKNDEIKNTLLDRKIVQKIKNVEKFDEIDKTTCEIVFKYLSLPMDDIFKYIPEKPSKMTKILGKFFYNYSLLLNEKVFYCSTNHELTKEAFFERLCKKLARLELNIGSIIPAYNVSKEKKYYRVAAKLVTAEGLISYTLIPLTKDMRDIEPIRIFKGTSVDVSSLDFLSFLITDFEREIGRKAFLSGMKYEYEINKIAKVTTEIGFSLGGTIIQHRLASKNTIENAYLFNSPGVSKQIIEAVNKQYETKKLNLFIRRTEHDIVDKAGQYHVGYNAPENIKINFLKFINQSSSQHEHTMVFLDRNYLYAITGGDLNQELKNISRSYLEYFRFIIGGFFLSYFFRFLRVLERTFFDSRILQEKGLYIEDIKSKEYKVNHFIAVKNLVQIN